MVNNNEQDIWIKEKFGNIEHYLNDLEAMFLGWEDNASFNMPKASLLVGKAMVQMSDLAGLLAIYGTIEETHRDMLKKK